MHTANYLSTHTDAGLAGKYPLSLQTLDFIQKQLLSLQSSISSLVGKQHCILASPTATEHGLVLIEGELLPIAPTMLLASLEATPLLSSVRAEIYLYIQERNEDITADGTTYRSARTYRIAHVGDASMASSVLQRKYPIGDFILWGDASSASLRAELGIEAKIVGGELYIRHGKLPPNAQITLTRYKRRSGKRGARSHTPLRDARKAYVHWRHIQLSKGKPGEWHKPTVSYEDRSKSAGGISYIGLSVLETCHHLGLKGHPQHVSSVHKYSLEGGVQGVELMADLGLCLVLDQYKDDLHDTEADGWGGSRQNAKLISRACKSKHQSIYVKLALQVVLYDGTTHPDICGPMLPIRYRVQKVATAKTAQSFKRSITL